jgi:hypothetical protein
MKEKKNSERLIFVCEDTNEVCRTYKNYLNSRHWKLYKEKYINIYRKECAVCKSKVKLNFHHKTYENVGNESLDDVVILCRECHEKVHNEDIDINNIFNIKKKKRKQIINEKQKENYIYIPLKISHKCKNIKKRNDKVLSGTAIFIYMLMINEKDFSIYDVFDKVKNRVSENTIRKELKILIDYKYINEIVGSRNKRIYNINKVRTEPCNFIKINIRLLDEFINNSLSFTELKIYIKLKSILQDKKISGITSDNILCEKQTDLAYYCNMNQENVSKAIINLEKNNIIKRYKKELNDYYYTYDYELLF